MPDFPPQNEHDLASRRLTESLFGDGDPHGVNNVAQTLGRSLGLWDELGDLQQDASVIILEQWLPRNSKKLASMCDRDALAWARMAFFRTVLNLARAFRRRNRRRPLNLQVEPADERSPSALDQVIDAESGLRIEAEIERLPERQQQVLRMWSTGRSHSEIGSALEISQDSSRHLLHRAMTQLKGRCAG